MKSTRNGHGRSLSRFTVRWGAASVSCAVAAALVGSAVPQQASSVGGVHLSAAVASLHVSADPGGGPGGGDNDPGGQVPAGPRAKPDNGGTGNSGKDSSPTTPDAGPEKPKPSTDTGSSADKKETGVGQRPTNDPAKGSVPQHPVESARAAPPPPLGDPTRAAVPQKPGTVPQNGTQPSAAPAAPPVPDAAPQGQGTEGCVPGAPGCAPKPAPPARDGGGCVDPTKGCNSGAAVDDGFGWDDAGHLVLDGISFIPGANVPAASVNAAWYTAEGNYLDAGIAAAAIVPGGKWVTTGGKLIGKGVTAAKDLRKGEEVVEDGVKAADQLPGVRAAGRPGETPESGGARPGEPPTSPTGALPTPAQAQQLIKEANPVGSARKSDADHRSAAFAVDDISSHGSVFRTTGGDGREYTLVQKPGELNGTPGRFEWMVNDRGELTHSTFVRGGGINGKPNVR
ncbi:hypothetical protein [Pseudonocardia spinosispora]|uniref:hypothetical protein n=1 Tax=Pseudonocardia spinosispora TaxID=103441 RepID=UPI0012EC4363|nr:hypothetical protein [Pseudonocardia spinosispora]